MTAPGNSSLLLILLAVFVACCGYAAGRLHQRHQTEDDREEAYRDGYETATRSVFSMAARMIAPRRATRASARVAAVVDGSAATGLPAAPSGPAPTALSGPGPADTGPPDVPEVELVAADSSSVHPMPAPSIPASRPPMASETDAASSLGFPVPPAPSPRVIAEPAAIGGVVYRPFPDPRAPLDAELPPNDDAHRRIPAPFGPSRMPRSAPVPAEGPGSRHSAETPASGTPVPADSVSPADSGVHDRRAGRSRRATEPGASSSDAPLPFLGMPGPGSGMPDVVVGVPGLHSASGAEVASAETSSESTGRHGVPDELVQAATYRLPADRIFRAKVPDAVAPPEDPANRVAVPKPRQS
ncbi:hypothetical protein BJ973_008999 [Actinoplanes tereljensis]|uniref:Uncharacterized protein n=1 Tax=Paractinoplanes tereljensis TaxID=571912 RepID=A0A919TR43_9ACTN|nr:hypothetical protein [Actinoplanes tereljensis]GIF18035.1 hypothetical protein Ate02nite_07650 [Actinoplanes tereljensis]